ncbi:MAG: FAD/NAD(P)-binding protein [Elusimicrobiota bacterium]
MKNYYLPKKIKISEIIRETPDTKTFILNYRTGYIPGQFFMVGIFGAGESPISISGTISGKIALTIKRAGALTGVIHRLKKGDYLSIRGPFGNGFPVASLKQRDVLIIAGGLGIAPLRPVVNYILDNRGGFKNVSILYGARTPEDVLFKKEIKLWEKRDDINFLLTVDIGGSDWKGNVGVVTTLFKKITIPVRNASAIICGPAVMMKFTVKELLELGFPASEIILSLERHMKCGIGKCGHCYLGEKFVCSDGPVFKYSELTGIEL